MPVVFGGGDEHREQQKRRELGRLSSPLNGERLRLLRRQRFMERKEVAKAAGISYHTLQAMESRNDLPEVSTIRAVARVLRVPPDSFLSRDWHNR